MLDFSSARIRAKPFRHLPFDPAMSPDQADAILTWLETKAPWELKVAEFYEQYEFSFADAQTPKDFDFLFGVEARCWLALEVGRAFSVDLSSNVEVTAHRLDLGQRIRIHNDYIPGRESHRLLVQLNRGWHHEDGGLLMLFSSSNSMDLNNIYTPSHNSGMILEISPRSHHAVSTINTGGRFTLVFSFYLTAASGDLPL